MCYNSHIEKEGIMPEYHPLKKKIRESGRNYSMVARMTKKERDGEPYCVNHFHQMLNGVRPLPPYAVEQICKLLGLNPEEYLNDAKE
jgi:hypothetical protein